MTATDELCRMLAKMGAEYVLDEEYGKKYLPEQRVTWTCDIAGEDMTVTARDYCVGRDEGGEWEYCLDLEFHEVFTPTQAVAATVGNAALEAENAKLREQGARLFDKVLELGTKNDRLQKAVDYLCAFAKTLGLNDDELRELGVEVDG